MSISWASKLAIAFIRPFRSYIDGYSLFTSERTKVEANIRARIDAVVENAKNRNPNIDEEELEYTKECLIAINIKLIDSYDKNYGNILIEVLNGLTLDLESEINNSFNAKEQQDLIELISNPTFQKLLQNKKLFSLLKKSELDLEYKLRLKTMVDISDNKGVTEMKNLLRDLKKKKQKGDENDFDFPLDEENQNDIDF
jgi:hypothetical protein